MDREKKSDSQKGSYIERKKDGKKERKNERNIDKRKKAERQEEKTNKQINKQRNKHRQKENPQKSNSSSTSISLNRNNIIRESASTYHLDIDCDLCKDIMAAIDDVIMSEESRDLIAVIAAEVCKILKIEDDRVCDYITREFKVSREKLNAVL